ncbi:MAG: hypothetical protein WDO16_09210 [Bacteroidota bacterium]
MRVMRAILLLVLSAQAVYAQVNRRMDRLAYNHPDLTVDLAVGLGSWPLPMDYNDDGLLDLVVACADVPYDGIFLFENTGRIDKKTKMPVFSRAKKLSEARKYLRSDYRLDRAPNIRVSNINGQTIVLTPGKEYPDFKKNHLRKSEDTDCRKKFSWIGNP